MKDFILERRRGGSFFIHLYVPQEFSFVPLQDLSTTTFTDSQSPARYDLFLFSLVQEYFFGSFLLHPVSN